jgi:uncharacterized protein YqgV (UPF0045/DUF77 family)
MNITAEISLYPLAHDFVPAIRKFIRRLRAEPGIEVVTNQLSTQVRGAFGAVTGALERCMRMTMEEGGPLVFVVKYVNADLPIGTAPQIDD